MSNRLSALETKKRQLFRKESSFFWKLRKVPVQPIVSHRRFQKLPNARPLNPASGWTQMNSEIRIENQWDWNMKSGWIGRYFVVLVGISKKKSDTDKGLEPRHRLPLCLEVMCMSLYIYMCYSNICINFQFCASTIWIKIYVNFVCFIYLNSKICCFFTTCTTIDFEIKDFW